MIMHSTTISSSLTTKSTTVTPSSTTGIQSYPYPPISTLRRASRPSNINLPILDHNNAQQSNDPGIYSAPIYYIKKTNDQQQHIQQVSHPYTAILPSNPFQQHMQLSSHHHSHQQNINLYQQQQLVNPYLDHQHTPHTFPLQTSPNNYHQHFYFPPSELQINMTNNGRQPANTTQTSTSTHNNHLQSTHIQEPRTSLQQSRQWSNPALSSLMVKRMNENSTSISIDNDGVDNDDDDDEDPSASIDALVADVDSNSQDLLEHNQTKPMNALKTSSTLQTCTTLPASNLYLRSKSHILTTPPNPLASDDHPDNQINNGITIYKNTYSPIRSAGFELASTIGNDVSLTKGTNCFTFDTSLIDKTQINNTHHDSFIDDNEHNTDDILPKSPCLNTDMRTTRISSNSLIQDDNSNPSSTNSSSQHTSTRIFSQMLKSSEQQILSSSSSPLSNDIKLSSLDHDHLQTNISSISSVQQLNRHLCTHPNCSKTFTNKSALAKHKLTHSQDRKHICPKCTKSFKRLDHLNGHMLTHEEDKPHKCRVPKCNRTYCDSRSLKRHIENAHQDILAAIHERRDDEYRKYLPDTAIVTTKDLSKQNDFSIDSIDSNSPQSLVDDEKPITVRESIPGKSMIIYTFDEAKCVKCSVCKKTFKNGAALNGHMRLHGGFVEKPPSSPSTAHNEKSKRTATGTKRKRIDSSSGSMIIKSEAQDSSLIPTTKNRHQQSVLFSNLPSSSNLIQTHLNDRTTASPVRSLTPVISIPSVMLSTQYPIVNHQSATAIHLIPHSVYLPQMNTVNSHIPFNSHMTTQSLIKKTSPQQCYGNTNRESFTNDHNSYISQSNEIVGQNLHGQSSPFQIHSISPDITRSMSPILIQHVVISNTQQSNSDNFSQQQLLSSPQPNYCMQPTKFISLPAQVPQTSVINTLPVIPSNANQFSSHYSPVSPMQTPCNKENHHNMSTVLKNSIQLSPVTQSASFASSPLISLNASGVVSIENSIKQESHDDTKSRIASSPSLLSSLLKPQQQTTLDIVPDRESPTKNSMSAFLISTPSSTGTGSASSSSLSSNTHFNYEDIPPLKKPEPNPSSFQWPSQLRRQSSLNFARQVSFNAIPSTPYTPPPMLSPFRKGSGLYYRAFSNPGISTEPPSIPTTPILPSTPIGEELSGPKINIGSEYQAAIPKLRTKFEDNDRVMDDELLFSPSQLLETDEKALEKLENLNQMNPFLFSQCDSPKSYPLELIYMLLHEYNGDLSRTVATLLDGTANDLKQCRPLHSYHFPDCDAWTKEEINAFTKVLRPSEKNFSVVSLAVGTKTVKQCIEFYYMPKVSLGTRKTVSTRTSNIMTRPKRIQLQKAKQQQLDDEMSLPPSSFSEYRIDDDSQYMNNDNSPLTQYSCDVEDCLQTFTSQRAYRAHRKDHRRTNNNKTSLFRTN